MRELSPQELINEIKMVAQITEKLLLHPLADMTDVRDDINRLGVYLQASETKLIRLMNNQHPSDTDPGATQYGMALYLLDTTHPVLRRLLDFPKTQITLEMLKDWDDDIRGAGVIDYDGTMISTSKFGDLDAGWITALIFYIALKLGVTEVSSWAPFGTTPAVVTNTDDTVKIAIIGDWGTGPWTDGAINYPALEVINQVPPLTPDYTIHLGDVYYAGTGGFLDSDEEVANFIDNWPSGSQGSFMLNSNHEMYSGALGFFAKGLKAPIFSAQQNTSYFAIEHDKWIIIGLDTAYYDPSPLFMNGALNDANQISFIKGLNTANKTIILLTHHNPTSVDGTSIAQLPLWNQVIAALGRVPDFWYWGHVHNGMVYSDASFPAQNGVKARCAGHGAIPFGVAWGLQNPDGTTKASIAYFAHELLSTMYENTDPQQAKRVLNGFAMLTIGPDSIKEQFLDQTGTERWSQTTAL